MKITVTNSIFHDAFVRYDRATQFSYDALDALFDYYDQEAGEDAELDVIAICCDWNEVTEYGLIDEYGYMIDLEDYEDDFDRNQAILEALNDETYVIDCDGSYLVQAF